MTNQPPRGLLNPTLHLFGSALLVTAAELLLKVGASAAAAGKKASIAGGIADGLASPWTWAGIVCYVLSFLSWLHVLRWVPLIVAFNLMNGVHILVPVGSWLVLGESIPPARWVGIGLITAGLFLIAKPLAKMEERL